VVEQRLWLALIDEMLHEVAVNDPPAPLALHETLPAGVEAVPWEASVTVAVSVTLPPATTVLADEVTLMLEERWLTVMCTVPVPLNRSSMSCAV
jgi:hypothetical protein